MPGSLPSVHPQSNTAPAEAKGPFRLTPLPYAYEALEPVIDRETMFFHHDVIQREYVEGLNQALQGSAETLKLEEILARVSRYPKAVRDNGGGMWNHEFYWCAMTDKKEDQEISPELLHAFENSFGSVDEFKSRFIRAGAAHVGSGWIWVVKTPAGRLEIVTTEKNDNPLMDTCQAQGRPILVCDLWEHAYFLRYRAAKGEYIRKFFAVVNWARMHTLFVGEYH